MNCVAALNNAGVALIELGELGDAGDVFRDALASVYGSLTTTTARAFSDDGDSLYSTNDLPTTTISSSSITDNPIVSTTSCHPHPHPHQQQKQNMMQQSHHHHHHDETTSMPNLNASCTSVLDPDWNDRNSSQIEFVQQVKLPDHSLSMFVNAQGIRLVSTTPLGKNIVRGVHTGAGAEEEDILNQTITCCIIMYNLALSHHLQWSIDRDEGKEYLLCKAYNLYMKVGALLDRAGFGSTTTGGSCGIAIVDYLVMSSLNNLGYLAVQMANFAAAQSCYQQCTMYAQSIEMVWDHGILPHPHPDVEFLLRLHRSCFLLNALLFLNPMQAPAA